MVKNTYSVTLRVDALCAASGKIMNLLEKIDSKKEKLPVHLVMAKSMVGSSIGVYLDEVDASTLCGTIKKAENKTETLSNQDLEELINDGNYEINLTKASERTLYGTLDVLVEVGAAIQKSDATVDKDVQEAVERIIANGLATKEEMDERLEVFKINKVDKYLLLRTLNDYKPHNKPSRRPSTIYHDPYLDSSSKKEGLIAEGLRSAMSRNGIICEGEKSTGKNVYLETIAWLKNMPMYLITFSRNMSPSYVYGEKTTDNSATVALTEIDPNVLALAEKAEFAQRCWMQSGIKQGYLSEQLRDYVDSFMPDEWKDALKQKAEFDKKKALAASVNIVIDQSELYDWLIGGGIMVFNEVNMAEPNFLASFTNQLLDGTGFLFVPGRGEVPIRKDCILFATQNADYAGTDTQNEATLSRFGCIVFPQPEKVEKQLIAATNAAIKKGDCPNASLDDKYYQKCQELYSIWRASVNKQIVTNACLNIRGFVRALTAVAESNGIATLKRQIEIHVINTCPVDDRLSLYTSLEQVIKI